MTVSVTSFTHFLELWTNAIKMDNKLASKNGVLKSQWKYFHVKVEKI